MYKNETHNLQTNIPNFNRLNIENYSWLKYLNCNYEPAVNINLKYSNPFSIFIDFMIEKSFYEFKKIIIPMSKKHKHVFNVHLFYTFLNNHLRESLTAIITPKLTLEYNTMQNFKNTWADAKTLDRNVFISLLSSKSYKHKIFKSNPELLKNLASYANYYINTTIEIYLRITTDYLELINIFGKLGKLISLSCTAKDFHSNANNSKVCQFENNSIVYISWPKQSGETTHKITDLHIDQPNSIHMKETAYEYREYSQLGFSD
jgi:lantibiotic modifying enzyme